MDPDLFPQPGIPFHLHLPGRQHPGLPVPGKIIHSQSQALRLESAAVLEIIDDPGKGDLLRVVDLAEPCLLYTSLVNGLHRCVHSCVKADSILGTSDIQVNGSRDPDGVDPEISQLLRAGKGSVSSDDHLSLIHIFSSLVVSLISVTFTS